MTSFLKKILVMTALLFVLFPLISFAQLEYTPLAPLTDEMAGAGKVDIISYVNIVYKFAIVLAGALAVIMIVIGGAQYMTTDAISGKEEGLDKVKAALSGLLLILASYAILNSINPKLVEFSLTINRPVPIKGGGLQSLLDQSKQIDEKVEASLKQKAEADTAEETNRKELSDIDTEIKKLESNGGDQKKIDSLKNDRAIKQTDLYNSRMDALLADAKATALKFTKIYAEEEVKRGSQQIFSEEALVRIKTAEQEMKVRLSSLDVAVQKSYREAMSTLKDSPYALSEVNQKMQSVDDEIKQQQYVYAMLLSKNKDK